jgi:predicted RNase H-like nuclease (RuvC/YqgF family)
LKFTREQLSLKEDENDNLLRTVRAKAKELYEKGNSQLLKQVSIMTSELVEKDTKVSTLKRRIGDLRKMLQLRNSGKPPSSKLSFVRSQSVMEDIEECVSQESTSNMEILTVEEISELRLGLRLLDQASALECNNCKRLLCKTQFESHLDCTDCSNFGTDLHVREYRNIIRELRAEQKTLRREVERLMMHLRKSKEECAVQAERSAEREHDLKSQQKVLINHILVKEPEQIAELAALLSVKRVSAR